ncbi:tRNA (adenosine(37)-N6)-threonylcarbamoyltransferase complex transferase subunit TsaD, partial [Candidatus Saccharibacteria bacterium 32-49-10]
MKILGIESSCDETAAAVVENGVRMMSNVVSSQVDDFAKYGGVIPEIAARSHIEVILPVIEKALKEAETSWDEIDGIGVTYAPGLIGSLLMGVLTARTLAHEMRKPLYAVHHVEAHVYANFLLHDKLGRPLPLDGDGKSVENPTEPAFPVLALIVSGGHTQLALFHNHGNYVLLGQAQDDAVGEAFDKVAKVIGLPYPGGVSISKLAPSGNATAFSFPKAHLSCPPHCPHDINRTLTEADIETGRIIRGGRGEVFLRDRCHKYDFSFSGVKTAVLRAVQHACSVAYDFPSHELPERVSDSLRADVAASFQRVAVETLVEKTVLAYEQYAPGSVVIAGGVAANKELRRQLADTLPVPI